MAQYCRYCAELYTGNGIYCAAKDKELSEAYTKRANFCKYFAFCELDAYDFDKKYRPRQKKEKTPIKQISIEEISGLPIQKQR